MAVFQNLPEVASKDGCGKGPTAICIGKRYPGIQRFGWGWFTEYKKAGHIIFNSKICEIKIWNSVQFLGIFDGVKIINTKYIYL